MSKRLENEYKMLIKNDVPDLWARIEGGLEPKTGVHAQTVQAQDAHAQAVPENETVEKRLKNRQRLKNNHLLKSRRGNYRIWATVAAACICVAVAIPAWLLRNNRNSNDSDMAQSTEMQADASLVQNATAFDNTSAMDCASADTAVEWEEAAAGNAAPAEEPEETLRKESARAAAAADMAEEDKAATTEAVANNSIAEREASVADLQSQSRSEYEITVTVTICSIEESPEQVLYTARVEQAADETLVGTQIEIFGSMDTDERLKPDVEYQLELTCAVQEDRKTVFYQKTP